MRIDYDRERLAVKIIEERDGWLAARTLLFRCAVAMSSACAGKIGAEWFQIEVDQDASTIRLRSDGGMSISEEGIALEVLEAFAETVRNGKLPC